MTWGSSHAQLPRVARPRWCQRGWPPRRGSWSCQRKSERHGKVLPQPPTHHAFTLSPHLLPPSPPWAGDKAKPRVQDESSWLGRRGTPSILIKMSSTPRRVLWQSFGFDFVWHVDKRKSKPVLHQGDHTSFRWGVRQQRCLQYVQKGSTGTDCDIFCIPKPWLKVCNSHPFMFAQIGAEIELHLYEKSYSLCLHWLSCPTELKEWILRWDLCFYSVTDCQQLPSVFSKDCITMLNKYHA